MANININFDGLTKLKDWWSVVKSNFTNINDQLDDHIYGVAYKHAAENITFDSTRPTIPGDDVLEAIEQVDERISNIIAQSGTSDTEVVDARVSGEYGSFATLKERADNTDTLLKEAKDIIAQTSVSLDDFDAVGDGLTDDSTAVQAAIDYCIANNVPLFIPRKSYVLESEISIPIPIYMYGFGVSGLSTYLNDGTPKFIIKHSGIGFNLTPASGTTHRGAVLRDFTITCHEDYAADTNMVGIFVKKMNHNNFDRIAFQEFRAGKGIEFGDTSEFCGQYSNVNACKFGMCLFGVYVNTYYGVHIHDCMLDGNNNGSDIAEYTHGYPDGSHAIHCVTSGRNTRVYNNRIQGFEVGVYSDSEDTVVENNRMEMCYYGTQFDTNSSKCCHAPGNKYNNYLILTVNGIALSGRYGRAIVNSGDQNTLFRPKWGSCYYCTEDGTNTDRQDVVKITRYLGDIDATTTFYYGTDGDWLKDKAYRVRKLRMTCSNFASIDTTYSNRWKVEVNGAYLETYSKTFVDNEWWDIGDSPNARANDVDYVIFTKYASATTLENVIVDLILEPY